MNHSKWMITAVTALAIFAGIDSALAASGKVKEEASLLVTGADDDARGRLKLQIRGGSDGRFDVRVQKLAGDTTYEVLADGVAIGTITTSGGGNGRLRFRSAPRSSKDVFLGFDPRGMVIVIRDASGADLLAAMVPSTSSSSGSGDVICCVPDDSGPECEDRTPEECAAEGGTVSTATSCLPNPCAGTAPPAGSDIVCCIPDDSGPECEDRTVDECALAGGVVIEATSCLDNPCAGTPAADPDIQCCLADDSGPECEDRTPAECAAESGVNLGTGTCLPNPCADVIPPGNGSAVVEVTCERRSNRSKVSVDGNNLAPGSYQAVATSGTNEAASGFASAVGDEAEFDFDSNANDIAAGATAIAANFIQGTPPQVIGQIRDSQGTVVASAVANCLDR